MSNKYKPNDTVFIRLNTYDVAKGTVYSAIQKVFSYHRTEYFYEILYAGNKVETFAESSIFATADEAFK